MKIKKFGHCSLLIQTEDGSRIISDPGSFSSSQDEENDIDLIIVTHEHYDHLDINSLKNILNKNKEAKILSHKAVCDILKKENIESILCEEEEFRINNTSIFPFKSKHEEIYKDFGQVDNFGYLIDKRLFLPGDSFSVPPFVIDILALPVSAPWCDVKEALNYTFKVKPRKCFPIHDGLLNQGRIGSFHKVPEKFLNEAGINFIPLEEGQSLEL